jgi:acyl carrier protein
MEREKVRADFLALIQPFVRKVDADQISDSTLLVDDLNIHSARLVDIILEMEDRFSVRIDDDEAGELTTVGSAVDLLMTKIRKAA